MNGHEKSDPIVVAMKPANKAGRPVAERVERRVGTEGNAGQHNTRRAQNRESMTQALARVRQAHASPSNTRGRSRMRAIRTYGSVRGARGNSGPLYVAACSAGNDISPSSKESGESHASLRSTNPCGR